MSFRGGGNKGNGRVLLPFGLDYADVASSGQITEKPQYILPVNGKPSEIEILAAKHSINFNKLVSDGPFYTGKLDQNQINKKDGDEDEPKLQSTTTSNSKQILNNTSEDGIERYSDRYKKVQKIGRTIQEHPYQLQFFPEELYSVMGISNKNKNKYLSLSKFSSNGGLKEYLSESKQEDLDSEAKAQAIKDQFLNKLNNEVDNKLKEDGEDLPSEEEEEVDEEFEDEEDDDYNAEQYFSGGEDDGPEEGGDDEPEM
ncbi:RPC31 [Candida jiufengensis]|uniref:RPC31 n=1 Tax=Candida jiufengensis TaxID=497108 RepID=UPI0022243B1F|nr:RPC31 [Candida jiufengensis]KAI5950737.1 RPC31 [Candida jiufengensis]